MNEAFACAACAISSGRPDRGRRASRPLDEGIRWRGDTPDLGSFLWLQSARPPVSTGSRAARENRRISGESLPGVRLDREQVHATAAKLMSPVLIEAQLDVFHRAAVFHFAGRALLPVAQHHPALLEDAGPLLIA